MRYCYVFLDHAVKDEETILVQDARRKQALAREALCERKRKLGSPEEGPQTNIAGSTSVTNSYSNLSALLRPSRLQQLAIDEIKRSKGISESIIRLDKLQATALRRRENPMGAPTEYVRKPSGVTERPIEHWKRLQKNWRFIVQHSIKETSMDTYSTALRIYKNFCQTSGITDIWLTVESPEFLSIREYERDLGINPFSYQVTVLLSFIAHLYGEQQVSHRTAGVYLSGLRHWFRQKFLRDFDECFDEPIISQARSSLQYLAVRDDSLEADKKTLPFACDMIVFAGAIHLKKGPHTLANEGIYVCMVISFCCLMRRCEIFVTAANHYLRGQDVIFGVSVNGIEKDIYPRDAYKYDLSACCNSAITVHSAKNDWTGEGHRMFFTARDPEAVALGFDLVLVMFAWAQRARPRNDDAFLTYNKGKEFISYTEVSKVIKEVAQEFGFAPVHYHMHSLRVGGASTLAAAGHPSHYIQKMGRWKSLAFLQYIHWAVSGMADALRTLSNPKVFTAAHIKRINPAAVLQS